VLTTVLGMPDGVVLWSTPTKYYFSFNIPTTACMIPFGSTSMNDITSLAKKRATATQEWNVMSSPSTTSTGQKLLHASTMSIINLFCFLRWFDYLLRVINLDPCTKNERDQARPKWYERVAIMGPYQLGASEYKRDDRERKTRSVSY
jgi:hypothetical protein